MDGAIRAVHPSMVHCFLIGVTGGAEVDRGEGSGGFCRDIIIIIIIFLFF
jgi:hypothetical protein